MRSVLKMGRKLLIVASKRYGDYVKEIAESMGCFEEISFVDNDREGAIGKLEDVESFYPEYNCAIAACDDGTERLEWNKKLETLYNSMIFIERDTALSQKEIYQKIQVLKDACDTGDDLIAKEALRSVVPTFKRPEDVNKEIA